MAVARLRGVPWKDSARQNGFPAPDQRDYLIGGQQVDAVRNARPPNAKPRDEHEGLVCNGLSGGRRQRHPLRRQLDHVREVRPTIPSRLQFHQHHLPGRQPIGAIQLRGDGDRVGRPERLLDVDLSRSFVLRGNMDHNNGFIFKPVIRAANMTTAGRIEGMVKDTAKVKVKEAKVWITRDTTVATAFADTMGYYAIIGVPAGTYSIFATKEGYDTVKYENISVLAGSKTVRDFILTKK